MVFLELAAVMLSSRLKRPEASVEDEIREFLDSVFKAMKLEVTIDIKVDEDNRNVDVELNGPEMGVFNRQERSDSRFTPVPYKILLSISSLRITTE